MPWGQNWKMLSWVGVGSAGHRIVGHPGAKGLASRGPLGLTSYHHHPPSNLSGEITIPPYCNPDYCNSLSSAGRVRSRKHINRTIRTTITHRTLVWRGTAPIPSSAPAPSHSGHYGQETMKKNIKTEWNLAPWHLWRKTYFPNWALHKVIKNYENQS